jgi:hypothetical protein
MSQRTSPTTHWGLGRDPTRVRQWRQSLPLRFSLRQTFYGGRESWANGRGGHGAIYLCLRGAILDTYNLVAHCGRNVGVCSRRVWPLKGVELTRGATHRCLPRAREGSLVHGPACQRRRSVCYAEIQTRRRLWCRSLACRTHMAENTRARVEKWVGFVSWMGHWGVSAQAAGSVSFFSFFFIICLLFKFLFWIQKTQIY